MDGGVVEEDLNYGEIIRGAGITEYGRSLIRLGLRAQRMQSALRLIEWGGPDVDGRGPCCACSRFPAQGHAEGCFVAEALRDRDPITYAEDAIRYMRDLVHHQHHVVVEHAAAIQSTLEDLQFNLAEVGRIFDRL
jgi:hypothetical protein